MHWNKGDSRLADFFTKNPSAQNHQRHNKNIHSLKFDRSNRLNTASSIEFGLRVLKSEVKFGCLTEG